MADRPDLSPLAATLIWLVALIGSWVMGAAIAGSLNSGSVSCAGSAWTVFGAASVVPVMVMVAVAPDAQRRHLVALAVMSGLVVLGLWASLSGCLG